MVHSPVCRCYCFPFYPALNCATSDYPFPEPPSTVSTQQLLPCVTYEEVFQAAAFRLNFPLSPVGSFSRSFFFIIGERERHTQDKLKPKIPLGLTINLSLWLSTACWHLSTEKSEQSECSKKCLKAVCTCSLKLFKKLCKCISHSSPGN